MEDPERLDRSPSFGPGEELDAFRRRRAGMTIPAEHEQHFAEMSAWLVKRFELMAQQHDEQDRHKRQEIAKYPHGYAWHLDPGGGLPFDWSDAELATLRPHDRTQARKVRFVRVGSPRVRRPQVRRTGASRERRPGASRRSSSSSRTSSTDPGDASDSDEPESPGLSPIPSRSVA